MLTNEKLDVYERYSGSNDFWLRMGSEAELSLLQSSDWQLLYLYTDNIELSKNSLLADSFLKQHEADMLANCESAEVVERLKEITYKLSKKPGLFWRLWNNFFDWVYKLIS